MSSYNKSSQFHVNQLEFPSSRYIGMNNVPVLDQGPWSTCVTFAITAAMDALYNLYNPPSGESSVSQLCNLQLWRTFNPLPSGAPPGLPSWYGTTAHNVLNQITKYGYIDMHYQTSIGCGGLKTYPLVNSSNLGEAMSSDDFMAVSDKRFRNTNWHILYAGSESKWTPPTPVQGVKLLTNVRQAINQGSRIDFAMMFANRLGNLGATGSYDNIDQDAWVLSNQVKHTIFKPGQAFAHEMLIDGYDDNACITYVDENKKSQQQCGVLRIRNSLGEKAGDNGDFYMTYAYFKTLTLEAEAIGNDLSY